MVLISPVIDQQATTNSTLLKNGARILRIPFSIPVGPGQKIQFARVFARVQPIENDATKRLAIVEFNNRGVGERIWGLFEQGTPLVIDKEINVAGIKPNEENEITIVLESVNNLFNEVRWQVFADFFYTLVDEVTGIEEEPPTPPILGEPDDIVIDDPDDSLFDFDFGNFLFGDVNKTIRTVAIVGVVIIGVVVIPPLARAVTATQKLRTKTSRSAV